MPKKIVKKKAAPKKTAPKKAATKKTKVDEPSHKIISTSQCKTISGKSTITFHIATDDKNNIFIRVYSNSGGGYFSNEWISLEDITTALCDIPADRPITTLHLSSLFSKRSVNSPGFLLAALLHEGVLTLVQGKKRQYVFKGTEKLLAKISKKTK